MTASNSPLAYGDLRAIADRALANGRGVTLRCHDIGEANSHRTRFYKMRDLDRRANRETYPEDHPLHGRSPYDAITVSPCTGEDSAIVLAFEVANAERLIDRVEDI